MVCGNKYFITRHTFDNVETEAGVGRGGSGPETECYLAGSERAQ